MADRYWRPISGASGVYSSTTNWSATLGGAGGASVPNTYADTAYFINNGAVGGGACNFDQDVTVGNLLALSGTILDLNDKTISVSGNLAAHTVFARTSTVVLYGNATTSGSYGASGTIDLNHLVNYGSFTNINSVTCNYFTNSGSMVTADDNNHWLNVRSGVYVNLGGIDNLVFNGSGSLASGVYHGLILGDTALGVTQNVYFTMSGIYDIYHMFNFYSLGMTSGNIYGTLNCFDIGPSVNATSIGDIIVDFHNSVTNVVATEQGYPNILNESSSAVNLYSSSATINTEYLIDPILDGGISLQEDLMWGDINATGTLYIVASDNTSTIQNLTVTSGYLGISFVDGQDVTVGGNLTLVDTDLLAGDTLGGTGTLTLSVGEDFTITRATQIEPPDTLNITVGGNLNWSGVSNTSRMNLAIDTTWTLDVEGTANVIYARVDNSNASTGSTVFATWSEDLCGNTNWEFGLGSTGGSVLNSISKKIICGLPIKQDNASVVLGGRTDSNAPSSELLGPGKKRLRFGRDASKVKSANNLPTEDYQSIRSADLALGDTKSTVPYTTAIRTSKINTAGISVTTGRPMTTPAVSNDSIAPSGSVTLPSRSTPGSVRIFQGGGTFKRDYDSKNT